MLETLLELSLGYEVLTERQVEGQIVIFVDSSQNSRLMSKMPLPREATGTKISV